MGFKNNFLNTEVMLCETEGDVCLRIQDLEKMKI